MIATQLAEACFYLPPGSAVPYWRTRPAEHFVRPQDALVFNAKFAARPAGTTTRADGRRRIVFTHCGKRVSVYASHVVWMLSHGTEPSARLDHRDTNCTNDAVANLREATQSQNLANTGVFAHSTTGMKGVSFRRDRGTYRATIKIRGRSKFLGSFKTAKAAAEAYTAAARAAFGEFARVA